MGIGAALETDVFVAIVATVVVAVADVMVANTTAGAAVKFILAVR